MVYVEVGAWSGRARPRGAVVVGYNGRTHSRVALRWGAEEAVRLDAPRLVLYAANYLGMTVAPGPGLLQRMVLGSVSHAVIHGAGCVVTLAGQGHE
ncbi:hypothetical protein [Pseudonocardia adelaidensis]|uniref:Uncharacterized protein n=1 Tax=Pseudonocardia adelaidensis TaxID=648754 RepID=A0ABP9NGK9_9PSEU